MLAEGRIAVYLCVAERAFVIVLKLNASVVDFNIVNFGVVCKQALTLSEINVIKQLCDTRKCYHHYHISDSIAECINLRSDHNIKAS